MVASLRSISYVFFLVLVSAGMTVVGCTDDRDASEGSETSTHASSAAAPDTTEWISLFDGESLEGWHVHDGLPGELLTGGDWSVQNGAIVGTQGPPGHGGFLVTDRTFSDFEIRLETNLDYPSDSGIFLRVGPEGKSHQVTLDYRPDGSIGAIYLPWTQGMVHESSGGEKLFEKNAWNDVRVRIEGEPARIRVWLNDSLVTDFQHTSETTEGVPSEGTIGLQVHSGDDWEEGNEVRFRSIEVRPL